VNKERNSDHYNLAYSVSKAYGKEPEDIIEYYEMWMAGAERVLSRLPDTVVDIGCGAGHFARVLEKRELNLEYYGYDFSDVSIGMAKNLVKSENFNFVIADLYNHSFWRAADSNTIYVAFEFLEHIKGDLGVISKIPKGSYVVFSVPSFDSRGHVRYFESEEDVVNRYEGLIDIESMDRFKKPQKGSDNLYIYLFSGVIK
jgi:SAM-dependent methyltransferase